MNYFNKMRWWTLFFLMLVTLNIAALSFTAYWLLKSRQAGPPPPPKSGAMEFLVKELEFDSMQQQQFHQLVEAHRHSVMDIRKNNRIAKDAFFALLKEPVVNDSSLERSAREAVFFDQQLDMITFRHFQQVRKLCNEKQKEKFDAIIQEALHMAAPPAGGPPPGPPPRAMR